MLFKCLFPDPLARVAFPSDERIAALKQMVEERHPALKDVYATADGLKLKFEKSGDIIQQNKYYNGWQHGHYVTNLFLFSVEGRIIQCVLNVPGSIHDSTCMEWGNIYQRLDAVYSRTNGKVCVDSAFAANACDYLVLSAEDVTVCKNAEEVRQKVQATQLRQSAEWGMRAIQGAFPKMKDPIKYEEDGERRLILKLLPLLYNMRLELVGLNQLRNVYAPLLSKDAMYTMQQYGGAVACDRDYDPAANNFDEL